jgi:AAA domain
VKARGGMFAQLCTDLPWAQHLSEVWRMRNREERVASLALRDGGPEPVSKALDWYRAHGRLHCGDPVTMAHDALAGYRKDVAVGKDALLLCDTTEMSDALNHRVHDDTISSDTPTVIAGRGHRVAAGDLILTRRNDLTIDVWQATDRNTAADPVRNGDRWRVAAVNPATSRIAAERLTDHARAVFDGDYVREYVAHGYATTVHSAQGITADATHAVLSENTTRSLLYVAMTRGRDVNTAYLYERATEQEYGLTQHGGPLVLRRGTSHDAAQLIATIIATRDDIPVTAHDIATFTPEAALPEQVRRLIERREAAIRRRLKTYRRWRADTRSLARSMDRAHSRHTSRSRGQTLGDGVEMS